MTPHATGDAEHTRLDHLARFLEQDIYYRGLRPGEPYLTAAGAAALLGVSRMTANRALNVLAQRELLVRHRSRGTFIGPGLATNGNTDSFCVHYITFADDNPAQQVPIGRMLTGFQAAIPEATLKTHILPLTMSPQQFREEVEQLSSGSRSVGMVVTMGTRDFQRVAAESGLPAVVHGSVYPGIDLPSLEVDQEQTGRLMAEQAIQLQHRHLVFVAREHWRRGDNLALDGIQQGAAAAGLGSGSVMVRNVSTDPHALRMGVEEILSDVPRTATFICRLPYFAAAIAEVAAERKLRIPQDIGVVYDYTSEDGPPPLPYPCVRTRHNIQEQMTVIAKMLKAVASGHRPEPFRAIVPAKFDLD
jgi:DNA-binding LacI/PurR family transcriptional regulator